MSVTFPCQIISFLGRGLYFIHLYITHNVRFNIQFVVKWKLEVLRYVGVKEVKPGGNGRSISKRNVEISQNEKSSRVKPTFESTAIPVSEESG